MKSLILVLAALSLLCFSCSPTGRDKPKIGIAMRSFDDATSVSIRRAIETAALDKADLAVIDGQNQQSAQNMQVSSFFERKLGAIAVDPVDGAAVGPLVDRAKAQKTPLVFFDRRPPNQAMRSWDKVFFVGTRESEAGAAQANILASYWKSEPLADRNKDGILQLLVLDGELGGPGAAELAESCIRALGATGIKTQLLAAEDRAAPRSAASLIAKHAGRIEAVICADPGCALSAIEAFKTVSTFKNRRGLPIVALGEGQPSPALQKALETGSILGAAYEDTRSQGQAVFDLALALAKGSDPGKAGWRIADAKYVWIPYKIYLKNPDSPLP